jgi:hypothetical protein
MSHTDPLPHYPLIITRSAAHYPRSPHDCIMNLCSGAMCRPSDLKPGSLHFPCHFSSQSKCRSWKWRRLSHIKVRLPRGNVCEIYTSSLEVKKPQLSFLLMLEHSIFLLPICCFCLLTYLLTALLVRHRRKPVLTSEWLSTLPKDMQPVSSRDVISVLI